MDSAIVNLIFELEKLPEYQTADQDLFTILQEAYGARLARV
jgi:hypothetical protein